MCGVYQVAVFLTDNKHIFWHSQTFTIISYFLRLFLFELWYHHLPWHQQTIVVHEHEVSWPGLHLVNSPFWWSFYLCMRRIQQCTKPSFRVVFLKSQQEVVDSERIRILSTRSPAMEDISVCQRREILQMIQKILLRTGRSFFYQKRHYLTIYFYDQEHFPIHPKIIVNFQNIKFLWRLHSIYG